MAVVDIGKQIAWDHRLRTLAIEKLLARGGLPAQRYCGAAVYVEPPRTVGGVLIVSQPCNQLTSAFRQRFWRLAPVNRIEGVGVTSHNGRESDTYKNGNKQSKGNSRRDRR